MKNSNLVMSICGATLIALSLMLTGTLAIAQSTQDAADWLEGQQEPAGWFPWYPGGGPTTNTQGPSNTGLLAAYLYTGLQGYMDAALLGGDYMLNTMLTPDTGVSNWTDGSPRWATHDPLFLEAISLVTGDGAHEDFARTHFWQPLADGTYGDANWDAAGFGADVVTARAGQGIVELSPWDLSATAIAAHIAGEYAIRDALLGAIQTGLEETTAPGGWDVFGLAGAVWAAGVTGVELSPTAGEYDGMNTSELAETLAGMTSTDNPGAWLWSSTADPDDPTNGDLQASAFAIMALYALDPELYEEQIAHGVAFIRSLQLGDGAFDIYIGADNPNVESHAEALTAIAAVAPYVVYVDQANLGLGWTDDPAGAGIVMGYDAFASIADGIDGIRLGGTLSVAPGSYDASDPVSKPVTIGASGAASETTLEGNMTLASTDIVLGRLGQGFSIRGDITVSSGVDASGISINWNDLYGHVTNEGDGTLDARYNWWDDRHPRNATTGDIDYTPFLTRPVDEVISFIESVGLPVDQALEGLRILDTRGFRARLAWELSQAFGFSQSEAMQIISDYGPGRVRHAMSRSLTYEKFVERLFGYTPGPAGAAGSFLDRAVAGGAGTFGDEVVDAIYEISQPIIVSFNLEDYTEAEVTDAIVTAGLVKIEDGADTFISLHLVPYDDEMGLYYREIPTDDLPPGHYRLIISINDGSHFQELIELVSD
ncbi:MAG: hypothetical protein R6U88_02745 [Candidatus Bipolaricaulota bacterium]